MENNEIRTIPRALTCSASLRLVQRTLLNLWKRTRKNHDCLSEQNRDRSGYWSRRHGCRAMSGRKWVNSSTLFEISSLNTKPFRGLDKVARLSASDYKCRVVSNSRFTLPMTFRRAKIKEAKGENAWKWEMNYMQSSSTRTSVSTLTHIISALFHLCRMFQTSWFQSGKLYPPCRSLNPRICESQRVVLVLYLRQNTDVQHIRRSTSP